MHRGGAVTLPLPGGRVLDVAGAEAFVDGAIEGRGEIVVRHPLNEARHVWVPHLAPEPGYVMADAIFRSPAIIVADDAIAIALVPDLDDGAARRWLDYDHARREVTFAAGAYRVEGHVFYVREATSDARLRLHVVASDRAEDVANPYGMAARWIWERWGRPNFARAPKTPLAPLIDHVVRWAFESGWTESVWQDVDPAMGAPVFIVDVTRHPSVPREQRRWREPRSIWNQVWFSTQRCANGLFRHARRIGSADLESRARKMTEIALAAPQADGLFPAVLVANDDGTWRWSNSDRRPQSVSAEACHVVDAAFTCLMLLEWHALTGDDRARVYVDRFVERLVREQRASGAFPGWIEPDGSVATELDEGPESAVAASLLFEVGREKEARAAIAFLEGVARDGRWEDFETYWSCAPWGTPGKRVLRNGVFKQNTLSIAWCADAFFRAGDHARARRCLDELSLHQAVWDPPFLPAPALGGFGVMNGDSEWNDARQSLFAPLYLEIGRATNDGELVERGLAALRASFSMLYCPENAALARAYEARFPFFGPESYGFMMENQGHGGADPIGAFTIFTWGNGSALAAAATARDRFPEFSIE
jgi:hypothetical protein